MEARDRLIVAVDVDTLVAAEALAERLTGVVRRLKVGLELYAAVGPEAVRALARRGFGIMLDLKLHDIPETVARATARAADLGAELVTLHTAGGRRMMQAAAEAARFAGGGTKLVGVTVLTSLDEQDLVETGVGGGDVESLVARRAALAAAAGLDGVVASPLEAARVRAAAPAGFLIVTPGVRSQLPTDDGVVAGGPDPASPGGGGGRSPHRLIDDQKRTATAKEARAAGADYVVVGRPVRDAADPRAAAEALVAELA